MHTIHFSGNVDIRALWRNGRRARLKIEWGHPPSRFESGEGQTSIAFASRKRFSLRRCAPGVYLSRLTYG